MKNKILYFIAGCFLLWSCEDFLDRKPIGMETTDSFLSNAETAEENFEIMIRACYRTFYINEASYLNNTHHGEWMFGDWLSDDCQKGGNGASDFPEVLQWRTWTCLASTGQHQNNAWLTGFRGVGLSNALIENLETYKANLSDESYNRIMGEALFIRGYFYFYLAKVYASVPYFDKPVLTDSYYDVPKATPAELYAFIEKDLSDAVALVPEVGEWGNIDPTGRATKGAVRAILARVISMEVGFGFNGKTWQDVYDVTKAIISSGKYSLVPNYATIFEDEGEQSSESVFEINCDDQSQQPYGAPGGNIQVRITSPRPNDANNGKNLMTGGWGFSCPSQNLYDEYESGDVRRASTIIQNDDILWEDGNPATNERISNSVNGDCPTGYWLRKYTGPQETTPTSNVNGRKNMRICRYAEVLLLHAEAAYHIGEEGEALQFVNQIRQRAINSTPPLGSVLGNPGYPPAPKTLGPITATSGVALLNAIKHERRCELAMEGHRAWDLIRWGEYEDAIRTYIPEDYFLQGEDVETVIANYRSHLIDGVPSLPIPANEVVNFRIEQNPNY